MAVRLRDVAIDSSITSICGTYCIKNEHTDKVYIGISTNLRKRILKHLSLLKRNMHHNCHLQRAYNIYGVDSFTVEVLETYPSDISDTELLKREFYYQQLYKSTDPNFGYNILSTDADGRLRHSEEHRRHISAVMSGRPKDEEHKRNISIALTGRRGTPHTEEFKTYISQRLRGRHKSEEHRRKISAAKTGVPSPLRGTKLGPIHSEETKRKFSLSRRGELNPRSVKIVDDRGNIYLTIKDACKKLNLCRTTINKLIKKGIFRRL